MCGIVGYLGKRQATEVLIDGLSKLEYRGYDSAGVAVNTGNELAIRKFKGRLAILAEDLQKEIKVLEVAVVWDEPEKLADFIRKKITDWDLTKNALCETIKFLIVFYCFLSPS